MELSAALKKVASKVRVISRWILFFPSVLEKSVQLCLQLSIICALLLSFVMLKDFFLDPQSINDGAKKNQLIQTAVDTEFLKDPMWALHEEAQFPLILDIQRSWHYLGKNKRPDSNDSSHCIWNIRNNHIFTLEAEKLYEIEPSSLDLVGSLTQVDGDEKNFRIVFHEHDSSATVQAFQGRDSLGELELELSNQKPLDQEINASIFTRLGTVWRGKDLFLFYHGGQEHQKLAQMQRLEFSKPENYIHYLGHQMDMIFKEGHWIPASYINSSSKDYPLLRLEEISPERLDFSLWPVGGYEEFKISLHRNKEKWDELELVKGLSLKGVRAEDEAVIQLSGQRWPVKRNDWLLYKDGKWQRINTIRMIDQYVSGEICGSLLVIQSIEKNSTGSWQVLARIYSPSRTLIKDISISYQLNEHRTLKNSKPDKQEKFVPTKRIEQEAVFEPMEELEDDAFYWPDEEGASDLINPPDLTPEDILEMLKMGNVEKIQLPSKP